MTLFIIYLSLTIGISFICSLLEAILLSSTQSYLETLTKDNESFSKTSKEVKGNLDRSISSILVVNTFANTLGAAGVGAQSVKLFGLEWQTFIAVGLTLAILYFSEIIPKTIGATYWKSLVIPAFHMIFFLRKLTYPLVYLSGFITHFIKKDSKDGISREEILAFAEMGEKQGSLHSKESDLIENLLELKNFKAKDILTPRSVVFAFEADVKIVDAIEEDQMYMHSRIPIYEGNLDNVVGMVFNQSILEESVDGFEQKTLREIAVPVFMVSENIPVLNLIDLFVKRKEHLFLVHDSYGQTSGIVTLEDAIETLLGVEIVDEMDKVVDMQQHAKDKGKIIRARIDKENKKKEKEAQK